MLMYMIKTYSVRLACQKALRLIQYLVTIFFVLFINVVFAQACANKLAKQPLTPGYLLAELSQSDSQVFANCLVSDSKAWEFVLINISGGDEEWLSFAKKLKPFTDAAASESLNFAVAKALPKNPAGVLKLAGDKFTLDEICTVPFIEAPPEVENAYLDQAIAALSDYPVQQNKQIAEKCLSTLQRLR